MCWGIKRLTILAGRGNFFAVESQLITLLDAECVQLFFAYSMKNNSKHGALMLAKVFDQSTEKDHLQGCDRQGFSKRAIPRG